MTGKTASGANKLLTLIAVTLAFSFTFLSRYIWSPLMNDVSAEFGINATQAGLYISAFFAGYLITQIPGGILADKYQPKYILLVCTVLGGLMTGAMALLKSYEMGLVIRVVTGISAGCVMAQCSKIVAITFAPQQRAMAMAVMTLVFAFQRSYGAMIGVGIVYGAVSYLPSTHYTTLAMKRAGDRYSATAASTQNLLFQLSSLIMPVVLGYVLDSTNNNYSYNWYIFFGCCAVASVLCLLVKKNDN